MPLRAENKAPDKAISFILRYFVFCGAGKACDVIRPCLFLSL